MKKNKYYGDYAVGSSYSNGLLLGNNLAKAKKEMRAIALGTCPDGNDGVWRVYTIDKEEVAAGWVGKKINGTPIRFAKP